MSELSKLSFGKYLTLRLAKKVTKVLYEEAVYPAAKEFVANTENQFDDSALVFLNTFVAKWLAD